VVIATLDPNPLVRGKGIAVLTGAGIVVKTGLLKDESKELNRGFIKPLAIILLSLTITHPTIGLEATPYRPLRASWSARDIKCVSKLKLPVETASISVLAPASPKNMTEPFPNCLSICVNATPT
jgi:hypothetical protein